MELEGSCDKLAAQLGAIHNGEVARLHHYRAGLRFYRQKRDSKVLKKSKLENDFIADLFK